jgi:hypothetical protein
MMQVDDEIIKKLNLAMKQGEYQKVRVFLQASALLLEYREENKKMYTNVMKNPTRDNMMKKKLSAEMLEDFTEAYEKIKRSL